MLRLALMSALVLSPSATADAAPGLPNLVNSQEGTLSRDVHVFKPFVGSPVPEIEAAKAKKAQDDAAKVAPPTASAPLADAPKPSTRDAGTTGAPAATTDGDQSA